MYCAWIFKVKNSQLSNGEMPLKIRILIFLLWEHFLNTEFVVLVICVIYDEVYVYSLPLYYVPSQ